MCYKTRLSFFSFLDVGVENASSLKIVVLQGMFSPADFKTEGPNFISELEEDIAGHIIFIF